MPLWNFSSFGMSLGRAFAKPSSFRMQALQGPFFILFFKSFAFFLASFFFCRFFNAASVLPSPIASDVPALPSNDFFGSLMPSGTSGLDSTFPSSRLLSLPLSPGAFSAPPGVFFYSSRSGAGGVFSSVMPFALAVERDFLCSYIVNYYKQRSVYLR